MNVTTSGTNQPLVLPTGSGNSAHQMQIIWGANLSSTSAAVPDKPSPGPAASGSRFHFYNEVFGRGIGLINDLKAVDSPSNTEPIWLHIFSYGGDLFTALNIYDQIKTIHRPVYAVIDGVAASAATIIALGCDKVYMRPNAMFMIHQLSTAFWGTYSGFEDQLVLLRDLMGKVSLIYQQRSGITEQQVSQMLARDTWMNATDALSLGIIDGILDADEVQNDDDDSIRLRPGAILASTDADVSDAFEEEQTEGHMVKQVIPEDPINSDISGDDAEEIVPAPAQTSITDQIAQIFDGVTISSSADDDEEVIEETEETEAEAFDLGAVLAQQQQMAELLNGVLAEIQSLKAQVEDQGNALPIIATEIVNHITGRMASKPRSNAEADVIQSMVKPSTGTQQPQRPTANQQLNASISRIGLRRGTP